MPNLFHSKDWWVYSSVSSLEGLFMENKAISVTSGWKSLVLIWWCTLLLLVSIKLLEVILSHYKINLNYTLVEPPPKVNVSADAYLWLRNGWLTVFHFTHWGTWPLLLTCFNCNLIMGKWLHPVWSMGWNYLSIPKLQRCNFVFVRHHDISGTTKDSLWFGPFKQILMEFENK